MGEARMTERIPEQGLTIGEQAALLWTAVRSATRIARTFRSMRGFPRPWPYEDARQVRDQLQYDFVTRAFGW